VRWDFKYTFNCNFTKESSRENFLNLLRFDGIMVMSLSPCFLAHPVYVQGWPKNRTVLTIDNFATDSCKTRVICLMFPNFSMSMKLNILCIVGDFFTHITERISYNCMYLILACVKNFA